MERDTWRTTNFSSFAPDRDTGKLLKIRIFDRDRVPA